MEELNDPLIRVKKDHTQLVRDNAIKIKNLFKVRLCETVVEEDNLSVYFRVEPEEQCIDLPLIQQLQRYVDWLPTETREACGGEDSSYDSDDTTHYDGDDARHAEVSRTTSDTLGAEFAEYVTADTNYTTRLEFALKLGYTERQVQAALAKLGPTPDQNQLLEELIKIGAQGQGLGSDGSCDWEEEEPVAYEPTLHDETKLRPVVIDGSNVAMSHGNKEVFSCRGIKICVDWFRARGHKEITVFVPRWRKEASRPDNPITDQEILGELERERLLVFTPSRLIFGKRLVCYDDRYILRLATANGGIVVSNDNYRDLAQESPEFRKVVEERILMYSFVNDRFMPPDDPLGRSGPTLDNFLRVRRSEPAPPCPYGKKCTYGAKCKFQHPERGTLPHKTITERLVENAQRQLQARAVDSSPGKQLKGKSLSLPLQNSEDKSIRKAPLSRTKSVATSSSDCPVEPPPFAAGQNLHKKLQRQLTLNPGGDPRLWKHQGVSRILSADTAGYIAGAAAHQQHTSVARISSAPGPHTGLPRTRPPCSASDPQLSTDEARRRLHYHLANIFPEEQVTTAMQLYPTETNPQRICAAILNLFPSKQ
ncbi:unnamed protein product [Nezara viridula]|uniref:C3H1-type domain-containing protein n=1 Tax=Nezara viridula TaxID=85310 RepID=A0A9P0HTV4_NEZVI|nr:unnamed protein product [Nezara viridula]